MSIVPDYRLDMSGEPCPYPAVATLEAMPQLKKGDMSFGNIYLTNGVSSCDQLLMQVGGEFAPRRFRPVVAATVEE